eukprot:scaffold78412_cov30-Tisochrysis_lutea.AAC.1
MHVTNTDQVRLEGLVLQAWCMLPSPCCQCMPLSLCCSMPMCVAIATLFSTCYCLYAAQYQLHATAPMLPLCSN